MIDPYFHRLARSEELKWRRWIDDTFVHIISPNIYRTLPEAIDSFKWFSEFGRWNQEFGFFAKNSIIYLGAVIMTVISGRLAKRYF